MSQALSSSPDPLNDTPTFQSPAKPRRSSVARHSLPLQKSSPTKRTFQLDLGNRLSPQKIKVTVEAGTSDTENSYPNFSDDGGLATPPIVSKLLNHRRERTTTTTVPVKGLSDSEGENRATTPKRGRGRPRKSGTPVPANRLGRSSTPTQMSRRKRRSIGEHEYGDDEIDGDFQIGNGVDVRRGKGRPRKSTPVARQSQSLDNFISNATSKMGKGRRKTLAPEEVAVLEDEDGAGVGFHDEAPAPEPSGVRPNFDSNAAYSTYATIRPTTSTGSPNDESDVTIARFHPGKETPHKTGWSSPRMVDSSPASKASRPGKSYPSPSSSLEKAKRSQEHGLAITPVLSEMYDNAEIDGGEEDADEEGGDEPDEVPEFDTILEGEGFSMISVDSVPSLRQHLSSPPEQILQDAVTESAAIRTVSTAPQVETSKSLPSDGSGRLLEESSSRQRFQNRSLLSVQKGQMDDSFSSIPPEILDAATPARKTTFSNLLGTKILPTDDSFSSIASEILEAATPGRTVSKPAVPEMQSQGGDAYDDSFSAIPAAILDAATPAPLRQALFKPGITSQAGIATDRLKTTSSSQSACSALKRVQGPSTARLPTPEETPPPGDVSSNQKATSSYKSRSITSNGVTLEQPPGDESYISSQMKSSPPLAAPHKQTYTTHLHPQPQINPRETRTPSIIFSSPSLPPPIQAAREHLLLGSKPEQGQKPALSPTVRAGRVLQGILVPSSPRSHGLGLGSPFKSPVMERKSSSVVNTTNSASQERGMGQLPRLDVSANLFPGHSQDNKLNSSIRYDDPFLNSGQSLGEMEIYSTEVPEQLQLSDSRLSSIKSEGISLGSDDAMSWQAEEEVSLIQDNTSAVKPANSSGGTEAPLGADVTSHPSASASADVWEQKWAAERAAVSREIERADSSKVIIIDSEDDIPASQVNREGEDFGLLLETINSSSPAAQPHPEQPTGDSFDRPRRAMIPGPWRANNKQSVFSDELSHLSSPIPARVSLTRISAKHGISGEVGPADLSSYSGTQTFSFKSRARERGSMELSAFLASSPNKPLPVLTNNSQEDSPLPSEPGSGNSLGIILNSIANSGEQEQNFQPIPQKLDFKPRVRDPDSSFASSPIRQPTYGIFGVQFNKEKPSHPPAASSSIISTLGQLRTSTSRGTDPLPPQDDQASSAQLSSPNGRSDSIPSPISNEENVSLITDRTKEWTESVCLASGQMQGFTSPTKSCLRSPVKSPAGGSGSRNSGSSVKTVAFVSSSPIPSSPIQEPLSCTNWSRDHWLLLDSILQSWKPENQSADRSRRRNSTRVISRFLGKNVRSGDNKMKLEQWHLEVVDEFRGCVPGWKEETIALRVFALIVGERDRALGLVGGVNREVQKGV
jgi:serine/arginine repetitive matrix protein 2